jgi:hypothetical protein
MGYKDTLYCETNRMMLPKSERRDKERVYSFCSTLTVVEESENKATV